MIGASSANPLPAAAAAIVLVSSSSERRRSRPGNGNSLHKNPQEYHVVSRTTTFPFYYIPFRI
jgi:hypothetical protein